MVHPPGYVLGMVHPPGYTSYLYTLGIPPSTIPTWSVPGMCTEAAVRASMPWGSSSEIIRRDEAHRDLFLSKV